MSTKYSGKKQKNHPIRSLLLLTQPSVAVLAIMVVLMQWRVPTPLRIILRTELPQAEEFESLVKDIQSRRLSLSRIQQLEVHYPAFPKMHPVKFIDAENLELESLGDLRVAELERNPSTQEMLWQLEGRVSRFKVFSRGIHKDLRMTRFDRLLDSRPALYGLIAGWMLFTAFGWFKAYQELKR